MAPRHSSGSCSSSESTRSRSTRPCSPRFGCTTITQPDVAATKLGDELDQLIQRWGVAITVGRSYAVATNMIHVARTGDHAKTAEQVYKVLNERRIGTMLDADTIGPW